MICKEIIAVCSEIDKDQPEMVHESREREIISEIRL
jgi:hypothetical protein